jgi:tRNA (guanine37-N1)-methyltransferase
MNFTVLTIFPDIFNSFLAHGIIKKAIHEKKIFVRALNIRDFAQGRHKVTDDRPYGGGDGMIMKPEPLARGIREAKKQFPKSGTVLLTPQGEQLNQKLAYELSVTNGLILVCGRYEGVDERICDQLIDFEISIGDYVLTGGELGAMVVIDAVTRLIPGILGGESSAEKDSFSDSLLKHAHYTRPWIFEDKQVPEVLMSGNHKAIERWRLESSLKRTFLKRQDLLVNRPFTAEEVEILEQWRLDIKSLIQQ